MVKVKCHRCGYVWEYRGKLKLATCPNCNAKVKVEESKVEVKGGG